MSYIEVPQSLNNTPAWEGEDPTEFSVFLANSDTNVLVSNSHTCISVDRHPKVIKLR